MSISFAPELGDAVRAAAERAGMTLSEWLAVAAQAKLRADEYEGEYGTFTDTDEELERAARDLGSDEPA
jgi:hypothetical protein